MADEVRRLLSGTSLTLTLRFAVSARSSARLGRGWPCIERLRYPSRTISHVKANFAGLASASEARGKFGHRSEGKGALVSALSSQASK